MFPSVLASDVHLDLVANGRVLPTWVHNGERFAAARPDGTYEIRLRNATGGRRLCVVTVDGVNVIDGEDGKMTGRGYILAPHSTIDIPGFLRTNREAAAFTFARPDASYAAQTGRGEQNVGIVGVAVHAERARRHDWPRTSWPSTPGRGATMDSCPVDAELSCSIGARGSDLGTAYGARTDFATRAESFDKSDAAPALLMLRYATLETLRAWGVPVDASSAHPQAFPADVGVPAPAGWRG